MSSAAYIMSIREVPTNDAEWLGLTAEEVAHLRSGPCRLPTLEEVVAAIDSLGIDAHRPNEIPGHVGSFSVRNLETEHAISAALRLAPRTGPLIVLDESEMIPIVVRADDDYGELVAQLDDQRARSDQEARQWISIDSLSTYQWSWRSPDGPFERVQDLSWIETLGVELPVSDRLRNVVPHPDHLADELGIEGAWDDAKTTWTADAQLLGLGTLEVCMDTRNGEPLSLRCRTASAREPVEFAARLVRTFGPMVIRRWSGPSVLIVKSTDIERVTPLVGTP